MRPPMISRLRYFIKHVPGSKRLVVVESSNRMLPLVGLLTRSCLSLLRGSLVLAITGVLPWAVQSRGHRLLTKYISFESGDFVSPI